jgi:parallel beta-helix repeat protein
MKPRIQLVFAFVLLFSAVYGNIITVPGDQATIQAGIDAATAGDTVLVDPGTYDEGIDFSGKNIVVGSLYLTTGDTSYISITSIEGSNTSWKVLFMNGENQDAKLIGFTIKGGTQPGIRCANGSSPTLNHLKVINNTTGIWCATNSNPTLENLTISANTDVGLHIEDHSSPTVRNVMVSNNQKRGIVCNEYSHPLIENSTISGNGGGISIMERSNPLLRNIKIINNTAGSAAGVYIYFYSEPRFENVLIANNTATATSGTIGGGGVGMSSSSPVFVNVTIVDNHANEYGGGISAMISHPVLINSIVWNNSSSGVPEICSFSYSTLKIAYSNIKGREAGITTKFGGTYALLEDVINSDPVFDVGYSLQSNSPCIDAGAAYYELDDSVYVNISPENYVGAAPDIGFSEYTPLVTSITANFESHMSIEGEAPLDVQFIDLSSTENTTITSWFWDFGDGNTGATANPYYTYQTPGVYTVSLTVSDGNISDTKTRTDYIVVLEPAPVADFKGVPVSGITPLTVQFADQSTGDITSWLWDFGDGETSTVQNPSHVYETPDTFSVSLMVSDGSRDDTKIKTDYIKVSAPPPPGIVLYVSISGSDVSGNGSAANPFASIQKGLDAASAGDTVIVKDGTYLGTRNTELNFNGKSIILFSENGAANCIINSVGTKGFYLNSDESHYAIIRGFTIINASTGIWCEGASPTIEQCIIRECAIGIYSTINQSNDVQSAPMIRLNLILNNTEEGIQAYEEGTPIIVNNTIVGNQNYGIRTGFADAIVANNIVTGSGVGISQDIIDEGIVISRHNCVWNNTSNYEGFDAGIGDISSDPLFVGTNDYHLQSASPCIDAGAPQTPLDPDGTPADIGAFYYHQADESLEADFSSDVVSGTAPLTVGFIDNSSGDPISWEWSFGDGATSTEQNPIHVFEDQGIYTVTLVVDNGSTTDDLIKADYITVNEEIIRPPVLTRFEKLTNVPDVDGSTYFSGSFISNDIAYIVTSHNRLFKTIDGGDSWTDISPEQGTDFDKPGVTPRVNFINENIGTVAFSLDDGTNGYDYNIVFGYVWCTIDGGATWSQRFDVNEDQITHLQQVTENIVYVSGSARLGVTSTRWFKKITRNVDTGVYSLTSITPMPTSRPHVVSADWLNQNTGVALAKRNVPLYTIEPFITNNGGVSWTSIQGNLPAMDSAYTSYSDNAIQMIDENTIIFTYSIPSGGTWGTYTWRTENAGQTWVRSSFTETPVILTSLHLDKNSLNGIIVGYDSLKACYITKDGGKNWEPNILPDIPKGLYLHSTQIASDGTTWIIGTKQSIWKSKLELEADFYANTTSGYIPMEVHFYDASTPGAYQIITWDWSFGDGGTSAEQNPSHIYQSSGNYTVSLTVNDGSSSDFLEKADYITVENSEHAVITNIVDVPDDQGGWVYVNFSRSGFDTDGLNGGSSVEDSVEMYTVEINDGSGWITSNSTVAYGADSYSVLAHTTIDSSATSTGILNFRVIAGMIEGNFESNIMNGYSVDNLAPAVPTGLLAAITTENAVRLDWDASGDKDFQYFKVFRSTDAGFDPSGTEPFAETVENNLTDEQTEAGITYYYKISAVDFHGNESDHSTEVTATITAVDESSCIPMEFALKANYPNPFNPTTQINYDLPQNEHITITVFNAQGKVINILVDGYQAAGSYSVNFNGNGLASGLYFYTMEAGTFCKTMKMVLIR